MYWVLNNGVGHPPKPCSIIMENPLSECVATYPSHVAKWDNNNLSSTFSRAKHPIWGSTKN